MYRSYDVGKYQIVRLGALRDDGPTLGVIQWKERIQLAFAMYGHSVAINRSVCELFRGLLLLLPTPLGGSKVCLLSKDGHGHVNTDSALP